MTEQIPSDVAIELRRAFHKMAITCFANMVSIAFVPRTECNHFHNYIFNTHILDALIMAMLSNAYDPEPARSNTMDKWLPIAAIVYYAFAAILSAMQLTACDYRAESYEFRVTMVVFTGRLLAFVIHYVFFTKSIKINKQHSS